MEKDPKAIKTPKGRTVIERESGGTNKASAPVVSLRKTRAHKVHDHLHHLLKSSHVNLQAAEDFLRTGSKHIHDNGFNHPGPDELADRIYLIKDDLSKLIDQFKDKVSKK